MEDKGSEMSDQGHSERSIKDDREVTKAGKFRERKKKMIKWKLGSKREEGR